MTRDDLEIKFLARGLTNRFIISQNMNNGRSQKEWLTDYNKAYEFFLKTLRKAC